MRIYLFIGLTFVVLNSFAQRIGLQAGVAVPIADFSSDDVNSPDAGSAETGLNLVADYEVQIKEKLNFLLMFNYQSNPVNEELLESEFRAIIPQSALFTMGVKNWRQARFLMGLNFVFPLNESPFAFDTRFMLGLNSASNPEITVNVTDNGQQSIVRTFDNPTVGLSFLAGFGMRVKISEKVDLLYHLDYSSTNIEFEGVRTEGRFNGSLVASSNDDFDMSFQTIALSIGIAFVP
ncbi:MAG: hypothetical protein CMO34_02545 [Verrucomicrobia bacterium]|nr:hypothetical protein [Verrucomicrobiota bacterium]|tara:strand:+ start:69 stop:773 length:705 start_codon:yes stop_codon:yes gene_type:complete